MHNIASFLFVSFFFRIWYRFHLHFECLAVVKHFLVLCPPKHRTVKMDFFFFKAAHRNFFIWLLSEIIYIHIFNYYCEHVFDRCIYKYGLITLLNKETGKETYKTRCIFLKHNLTLSRIDLVYELSVHAHSKTEIFFMHNPVDGKFLFVINHWLQSFFSLRCTYTPSWYEEETQRNIHQ